MPAKRYIVATFTNGEAIDRTTSNANLRYGWRVLDAKGICRIAGFTSSQKIPSDARQALKDYPMSILQSADAVECEKPAKPSTKGKPWRIIGGTANGEARFIRNDKTRAHFRFATRAEADKLAEEMTAESLARHQRNNAFMVITYAAHKGPLKD